MVYVFLANGFEEMEALAPVDLLRRAGVEVFTVGVGSDMIVSSHNIPVKTDTTVDKIVLNDELEMIVLPGGMPGTLNLEASPDVLGAVDTEVFSKMYKTIKTSDVAGCMNLMEDIIMQGRDLSQFVTDFVWYLRNLLLIKTTDDIDKIEDVIEVSKDNIKDMIEDARDVDVDSIMRHIKVLSELSTEKKYATQKIS